MPTTAKEYAQHIGKSVSTARRLLEKMVQEGKATRRVTYEDAEMPRASYGLKSPPQHVVIRYDIVGLH